MILTITCKECKRPFKNEILHCKSSGKKFCPACEKAKLDKYNKRRTKKYGKSIVNNFYYIASFLDKELKEYCVKLQKK